MVSLQVAYPQDVGKFCQVVVEIHRLGDGYSKRAANQRRQDAQQRRRETAMGERRQDDQDADVEFTKVTISMPRWMHDDLRRRARRRGISVTELMRRAVALDAVVFDPAHPTREIVLRDGDGSTERILQPL
jgi:hypothetical protein